MHSASRCGSLLTPENTEPNRVIGAISGGAPKHYVVIFIVSAWALSIYMSVKSLIGLGGLLTREV